MGCISIKNIFIFSVQKFFLENLFFNLYFIERNNEISSLATLSSLGKCSTSLKQLLLYFE